MRRLLKTALLGALAYGGYVYVKQLLDEEGAADTRETASAPKPSGSKPAPAASSSSNGASAPSKADLYEKAQELDIKGRSKMSKSELQRAIRDAG
jgi:hypothetical protein